MPFIDDHMVTLGDILQLANTDTQPSNRYNAMYNHFYHGSSPAIQCIDNLYDIMDDGCRDSLYRKLP